MDRTIRTVQGMKDSIIRRPTVQGMMDSSIPTAQGMKDNTIRTVQV